MAMNVWQLIKAKIAGNKATEVKDITEEEIEELSAELYVRELAFWSCVNFMGSAISQCEFKTFLEKKEHRGAEYYLWNYEPNKNQNSSEFIHKWIAKLYCNNEALVVEANGQLLVADSYNRQEYAMLDDVFTQVTVGNFTFCRSFSQQDVLYIKLGERDMRQLINGLYSVYQKLIDYGMSSYKKSRGTKGTLELDTAIAGDTEFKKRLDSIQNAEFRSFAAAENAILPLYKGMKYTDLGSKTYSNEGTRDIRSMIDDVSDFTAKGFGIHPAILSGNISGIAEALDMTMTFAVDPLAKTLEREVNRKRNGPEGIKKGNYLKIDTGSIKHIDVIGKAAAIDKLISSGVYCVNEIRIMLGQPVIEENWAWEHFITKNYAGFESLLDTLKGGEEG